MHSCEKSSEKKIVLSCYYLQIIILTPRTIIQSTHQAATILCKYLHHIFLTIRGKKYKRTYYNFDTCYFRTIRSKKHLRATYYFDTRYIIILKLRVVKRNRFKSKIDIFLSKFTKFKCSKIATKWCRYLF